MKRQICILLAVALIFSLSGCFKKQDAPPSPSENATTNTQPTTTPTEPITTPTVPETPEKMLAVSMPSVTETTTAADGTVIFQYTYQNPSLVLHNQALADRIILDLFNRIDSTKTDMQSVADSAKSSYRSGTPWISYLYKLSYTPARIDQKVLSFAGTNEIYNGGPHPNRTCISASYDLKTGDVLTLASIMTPNAKNDDFCQLVLDGLSGRAEGDYLYENYAQAVKQRFNADACLDENWFFSATGLCFSFAPYEIAPYSSGVITVEIPYEKLQALVHPDYLPSARSTTTGTVTVSAFADTDLNKFTNIAELVTDNGESMHMIYAEGCIHDVKITENQYPIFASNTLSQGDAIMIQASQARLKSMELSYKSGDEIIKTPIIK